MSDAEPHTPNLLMLSHCVPDPVGGADRARAWQLLDLANQNTRVHLLCLCNGPVHFAQWRAISSRAVAVKIVSPQQFFRTRSSLGRLASWWIQDPILQSDPALPIEQWLGRATFDAVISTAPQLDSRLPCLDAGLWLCDQPPTHSRRRTLSQRRPANVLTHRRSFFAPRLSGVGLLGSAAHSGSLSLATHNPTIHIPRAIHLPDLPDVTFFRGRSRDTQPDATPGSANPIVLHADWTRPSVRKQARSLSKKLQPLLRVALPKAGPFTTQPNPNGPYALDLLGSAQLIVCLGADAHSAAWSTMQALALSKPVITDPHTAAALGLEHNQQALQCESETQVVAACLSLLDDPGLRRTLSAAAHDFVDRHFLAHPARTRFANLFAAPARTLRPVAAAA